MFIEDSCTPWIFCEQNVSRYTYSRQDAYRFAPLDLPHTSPSTRNNPPLSTRVLYKCTMATHPQSRPCLPLAEYLTKNAFCTDSSFPLHCRHRRLACGLTRDERWRCSMSQVSGQVTQAGERLLNACITISENPHSFKSASNSHRFIQHDIIC